jgi:hypothetical protein
MEQVVRVEANQGLCECGNESLGFTEDGISGLAEQPIYETGEKSDMSNYRPTSLLTTFSKLLERVMHNRLKQHINTNNIIASE